MFVVFHKICQNSTYSHPFSTVCVTNVRILIYVGVFFLFLYALHMLLACVYDFFKYFSVGVGLCIPSTFHFIFQFTHSVGSHMPIMRRFDCHYQHTQYCRSLVRFLRTCLVGSEPIFCAFYNNDHYAFLKPIQTNTGPDYKISNYFF